MNRQKLQKLILEQKKDDTRYPPKQVFSFKTSYTMEIIEQERTAPLPNENSDALENISKNKLIQLLKIIALLEELSPKEKILYLASTIGGLTTRDIESVFQNPIKKSMIARIISRIKQEFNTECKKVDRAKNIFRAYKKKIPTHSRAKYF